MIPQPRRSAVVQNHQSAGGQTPDRRANSSRWRRALKYWLGIVVQLTVPVGAFAAALIATHFEARSSLRSMVNQREQSDSQLRATMFGQLVNPIVGPQKDGQQPIDPIRYALLVQLLALNFNDYFEFGPLMESADALVASSHADTATIESTRWDLRSVAHRVIDRQIATLWEDKIDRPCKTAAPWQVTLYIFSSNYSQEAFKDFAATAPKLEKQTFYHRLGDRNQQLLSISAPNCKDVLTMAFNNANALAENVEVQIVRNAPDSPYPTDQFTFRLTPFSFPFSDNTLLAGGNRFAVFMKSVDWDHQAGGAVFVMTLRLRWFPKYFYPPTERPANQRDVQQQLKIGAQGL
jgi:hypothetical protein